MYKFQKTRSVIEISFDESIFCCICSIFLLIQYSFYYTQ